MISPIDGALTGKVALVTGASAGIGLEVACDLASLGAKVILGCRNLERGEAARQKIAKSNPKAQTELLKVELSSQASIRTFASQVPSELHILVNNAGILVHERQESVDGIELTWATNVLGYFLVTELLRERIAKSGGGRIVNVASGYAGGLELGDVEFKRRSFEGGSAYAQSKQANRMWTWALARRLEGTGVTANAMHPGMVDTDLLRKGFGGGGGISPAAGADTVSWLAGDKSLDGVSGKYWKARHEQRCEFRGEKSEEALWAVCERMTQAPKGK